MPKRLKKAHDDATVTAGALPAIADLISAYMKKLGSKGGKVSGAKRMEMPKKQRIDIAKKAAAARWTGKRAK